MPIRCISEDCFAYDMFWHRRFVTSDFAIPGLGLSKEVKGADAQLKDLRRTVEYVENNRDSFTHIDDVSSALDVVYILAAQQRYSSTAVDMARRCHRCMRKP